MEQRPLRLNLRCIERIGARNDGCTARCVCLLRYPEIIVALRRCRQCLTACPESRIRAPIIAVWVRIITMTVPIIAVWVPIITIRAARLVTQRLLRFQRRGEMAQAVRTPGPRLLQGAARARHAVCNLRRGRHALHLPAAAHSRPRKVSHATHALTERHSRTRRCGHAHTHPRIHARNARMHSGPRSRRVNSRRLSLLVPCSRACMQAASTHQSIHALTHKRKHALRHP